MTRHLCAAGAAARSTAAGVAAATIVAAMAHAATAETATQRVVRRGSRIGYPAFLARGAGRLPKTVSESVSGTVTTFLHQESSPSVRKLRTKTLPNVPERSGTCLNAAQWHRPPRTG